MKYGFVIDNRKCIGCHACTVACKSEHDVPVGVNRTWVKQTEKGEYPHTRRVFSVLRCNHCTDAPCVEICPTEALFTRDDGIVDFDNRRCIACKSCMQACPYDALYIDPETNTAAKCNYCAHRVDIGLEPACVNVCPEHAIISGDLDNPESEIAQLISRQQVTVRKAEKGTMPNVFYIDGDEASLNPEVTSREEQYIWSEQSAGVGHFAKYAEDRLGTVDIVKMVEEINGPSADLMTNKASDVEMGTTARNGDGNSSNGSVKSIEALMRNAKAKRVYDTPDKGILWGWEVSGYVWTKAISAGAILVPYLYFFFAPDFPDIYLAWGAIGSALVFLALTGILLIKDLDQPTRFPYVLLRPQWNSWLVKGGYAITIYGGMISIVGLSLLVDLPAIVGGIALNIGVVFALIVAIYTAFLFAQAKGRDFWQSPAMVPHMLGHSLLAGAAWFGILGFIFVLTGAWGDSTGYAGWISYLRYMMIGTVVFNLLVTAVELSLTHPTGNAARVAHEIKKGRYSRKFWLGAIGLGSVIPVIALAFSGSLEVVALSGILALVGIYIIESIWIEAPQRVPLT